MDHADHVWLLRDGVPSPGGTWGDFGSGSGAFTLALAELLGPGATIWSVDHDHRALVEQRRAMTDRFPSTTLHQVTADFTEPLLLPPLDGIVMANSLHFVRDKAPVLARIREYLKPDGKLLIVEYGTDRGNHWVPYPFAFARWQHLAANTGFTTPRLLATHPSRWIGDIYSAECRKSEA